MNKKLKIQFWRAEKALAMQILEQEGLPSCKEDGFVNINDFPWIHWRRIELRGDCPDHDWDIGRVIFDTNAERDAYLHWAVAAITDELFTEEGELKVGEKCEVRDDEDEKWRRRKLITILPEQQSYRFVVETLEPHRYVGCEYARPISKRTEPKIEECGQLVTCTWEEK